jgi:hypothetical protein
MRTITPAISQYVDSTGKPASLVVTPAPKEAKP